MQEVIEGRPPALWISGSQWLVDLPRLLTECADRWDLRFVEPSARGTGPQLWHGGAAVIVACRQGRRPVALKVTWPHPQARHEHLALRHWAGHGAVNLLAADPSRWALLLERLDGDRSLEAAPLLEAWEVIGGLRADVVAGTAHLDEDRVRAWSLVRAVRRALDEADTADPDLAVVSRLITIAKAMTQ
ncbi:hypothetical protein FGL98_17560 [Leekyejoonella antrihumi]|uniref:Kinase n=1 Tax=Leekyejoonella antrihumi TaxID=1660198 RepID=A0A563DVX9_9MICO|nr:hypothetical protein FGL98_17560 [Leekyejoonella antrihumi]